MANAKSAPTPLPAGYYPMPNTESMNTILQSRFQQVIRSLLYLSLGTHPNIAYAIMALACQSTNPFEDHLNKALYTCHYLIRTWNYSLNYGGHSRLGIMACIDSDWGSYPTLGYSQTSYFFKIAGGLFSWYYRHTIFPLFFLISLISLYALMPLFGLSCFSSCSNYLIIQTLSYLFFMWLMGMSLWSRPPAQLLFPMFISALCRAMLFIFIFLFHIMAIPQPFNLHMLPFLMLFTLCL